MNLKSNILNAVFTSLNFINSNRIGYSVLVTAFCVNIYASFYFNVINAYCDA